MSAAAGGDCLLQEKKTHTLKGYCCRILHSYKSIRDYGQYYCISNLIRFSIFCIILQWYPLTIKNIKQYDVVHCAIIFPCIGQSVKEKKGDIENPERYYIVRQHKKRQTEGQQGWRKKKQMREIGAIVHTQTKIYT